MIETIYHHRFLRFPRNETIRAIKSVLRGERRSRCAVSVVFTDHEYIRKLNREFLQHNFSTDVIAFPLGSKKKAEGEIYVNLDRARVQARSYQVTFSNEARRLLIHGVLHLLGYRDKTRKEQTKMKEREDYYLARLAS